MATASSVNFQPIKSAGRAVAHAARLVEPSYLLPPEHSLGTVVVLDDCGSVAKTLEAKMLLASRQALKSEKFSPVWEGVINLRNKREDETNTAYKKDCKRVIESWISAYEEQTNHKVLRADIHLDEGHIKNGVAILNPHAHVIADRTNDKGRVIDLSATDLRKLQTTTAKITGLQRGENSLQTGRKHIHHTTYKYLAERGSLEVQKQENRNSLLSRLTNVSNEKNKSLRKEVKELKSEVSNLNSEIERLKTEYAAERKKLIESKQATQADYQSLKTAYDEEQKKLKQLIKSKQALQSEHQKLKSDHDEAQKKLKEKDQKTGKENKLQMELERVSQELERVNKESEAARTLAGLAIKQRDEARSALAESQKQAQEALKRPQEAADQVGQDKPQQQAPIARKGR